MIGSSGVVNFELRDGMPVLVKQPKVEFVDDGPGKPVGINRFIGRRPIMAFGNSDGDLQMLQYLTANPGLDGGGYEGRLEDDSPRGDRERKFSKSPDQPPTVV